MLLYIYSQLRGNGCLYIKAEQHNVAIPHDVFLALGTYQALFLGRIHAAAGHQVVVVDYLRADKSTLKVAVNLSCCLGALVPTLMVHARLSWGPAVR